MTRPIRCDAAAIEGIARPSGSYELTAKWLDDRLVMQGPKAK